MTFTCPRCGEPVTQRFGVYQCAACRFAPLHESD
jgi:ribosomal protein L37AE/L43A